MQAVTVYCGSGSGARPEYAADAREFGRRLAKLGLALVYGGGRTGLMGELADATLGAGGHVTGVIPRHLVQREVAHEGLTELLIVDDMHQRKARLASLGDCFVALPGGSGTLEEFFEAWTWYRLGLHDKPCALLNTLGYWDGLLTMLGRMEAERFLREGDRDNIVVEREPDALLRRVVSLSPESLSP